MEIEKNIPAPDVKPNSKGYSDMLSIMDIGDSIMWDSPTTAKAGAIRVLACTFGKSAGKKFTTRKVDGGIRMWRTQ